MTQEELDYLVRQIMAYYYARDPEALERYIRRALRGMVEK
jgi:hypothetical protein